MLLREESKKAIKRLCRSIWLLISDWLSRWRMAGPSSGPASKPFSKLSILGRSCRSVHASSSRWTCRGARCSKKSTNSSWSKTYSRSTWGLSTSPSARIWPWNMPIVPTQTFRSNSSKQPKAIMMLKSQFFSKRTKKNLLWWKCPNLKFKTSD